MRKLVLGVGGSSGALYAKLLFDRLLQLQSQWDKVGVVMSNNARLNWELELDSASYKDYPFDFYDKQDFMAPFASGSAKYDTLVICPCSMGQLGRIAAGTSDDLISRTADVMLKERRKLVLVPRDTPLNLIHINNMRTVTEAGGIILPASPSFYSKPATIEALALTVVDRILDICGFELETFRWGQEE